MKGRKGRYKGKIKKDETQKVRYNKERTGKRKGWKEVIKTEGGNN